MRPEFGPFVFHELKKIKKTFTFWLMVHSSPAESYVSVRSSFPCTILSSLGTSFHPFLTLCVQPKMPEPAGSQSLAGPHVHQDSLLPSLYGQIMSLIKPAWLRALSSLLPPSRVPADFPALGLSLPLSLSLCAQFILGSQAQCSTSALVPETAVLAGLTEAGWGRNCVPIGSRVWSWTLGMHLVLLRSW